MILIAAAILSLCTAVRWYLDRSSRRERTYAGGRIQLMSLWNRGSAFGLLPLDRRALAAFSALLLAAGVPLYRKSRLGSGLLLGGGISNLMERLRGGVYDYVRFPKAPGRLSRYVFNLADFFIFLGALLLMGKRQKKR